MARAWFVALGACLLARAGAQTAEECSESPAQSLTEILVDNLLYIGVDGHDPYDADGRRAFDALAAYTRARGHSATYILLGPGVVLPNLAQFTQIWVYDLSSGSDPYAAEFAKVAAWYKAVPGRQVVCDGRIISDYWKNMWQPIINYWENMRLRGGGLFLGTDHDVFQTGINLINDGIGINRFFGNYHLTYIPVDEQHPLMAFPTQAAFTIGTSVTLTDGRVMSFFLWDHSSPGSSPFGLQGNGLFFYTVGFHSGNTQTPGISSTIRGTLNFQVSITAPVCDTVVQVGTSVTLTAAIRVSGYSPYTYSWRSDLDGALGTGISITRSNLRVGKHVITVDSRDATNTLAVANVRIHVRSPAGASCTADNNCLSRFCSDSVCCTTRNCSGHGICSAAASGNCVCDTGYGSSACSACATNYFGPSCRYCVATSTCSGHGSCNPSNGLCSCTSPWTGPACSEGPLAVCDPGWTQIWDRCYVQDTNRRTWDQAQQSCVAAGGQLATVFNATLNEQLYNLCTDGRTCWIGANDRTTEGTFVWDADGSGVGGARYAAWAAGEPNNGGGNEDCVRFSGLADRTWVDAGCGTLNSVLCQKEAICPWGQYKSGNQCFRCPAGRFRSVAGGDTIDSCNLCPAGRYGATTGMTSNTCTDTCPAGSYCPAGTSVPTPCPAGRFGSTTGLSASDCSGPIAAGFYGGLGEISATPTGKTCRAGRWGLAGSTSDSCTDACSAGYYCPAGSVSATQASCGGAGSYCPPGSGSPVSASAGYRTIGGSDATTRTNQEPCPSGSFCQNGVATLCPAGRFAANLGQATCGDLCRAGYYCPAGSTSATQEACGGGAGFTPPEAWFCPAGSSTRRPVGAGNYTTPETPSSANNREAQVPVPAGFVATDGIRRAILEWTAPAGCAVGFAVGAAASPAPSPVDVTVLENAASSTVVSALTARSNTGQTLTLSVESQAAFVPQDGTTPIDQRCSLAGSDFPALTFDAATGTLRTLRPLNREACRSFQAVVRVRSANEGNFGVTCTLRVVLGDVNDAPSVPSNQIRSVSEDAASGQGVGAPVIATDEDDAQELSFSLVGGNADGAFRIGACDGQLFVLNATKLNHEVQSERTVTVRVSDNGDPTLFTDQTVLIRITDAPEPPRFVNGPAQTITIDENLAVNASVGASPITAVDEDVGQFVRYSIATNSDGSQPDLGPIFWVDAVTGQLRVRRLGGLDFESVLRNRHTVVVRATDSGTPPRSADCVVTVHVRDIEEAPIFPAIIERSVRELAGASDPVGEPVVAVDDDVLNGDVVTYQLTISAGGLFTVDASSGQIRVSSTGAGALDYETTKSYTVQLTARDTSQPNKVTQASVTIHILDENEPPRPRTGLSLPLVRSVPEGTEGRPLAQGRFVGSPLGVDIVDPDANQTLTYALLAGNEEGLFEIDALSGQMRVRLPFLDREAKGAYNLVVRVRDDGAPSRFADMTVRVDIENVNEPPLCPPANRTVAENAAVGSAFSIPLPFIDPDLDAGDRITFRLLPGAAALASALADAESRGERVLNGSDVFTVDEDGQLRVRRSADINFERPEGRRFLIAIDCEDTGGFRTVPSVITIDVANVFEAPVLLDQERSVGEQSPAGTLVGVPLVAYDDDGDALTFSLDASSNTDNVFALNATTGQLTVDNGESSTFMNGQLYLLRVTARDPQNLSATAVVSVTATYRNFPPMLSSATFTGLSETAARGTVVASALSATDSDNHAIRFSIAPAPTNDAAVVRAFAIDAATGRITVDDASGLDFETKPTITLVVVVTDDGPGELQRAVPMTIKLVDAPEPPRLPPTFSKRLRLREDAAVGSNITIGASEITATDDDAVDQGAGKLTFSLDTPTSAELASAAARAAGTQRNEDWSALPTAGIESTDAATQAVVRRGITAATGLVLRVHPKAGVFSVASTTAPATPSGPDVERSGGSYLVVLVVTDSTGLSSRSVLRVDIDDVNEAPIVTLPLAQLVLREDTAAMNALLRVGATDPEVTTRLNRIEFSLVGGNLGDAFQIDSYSGDLSLRPVHGQGTLDFENMTDYALVIRVHDNDALDPRFTDVTLPVRVLDVNDLVITALDGALPLDTRGGGRVGLLCTGCGLNAFALARLAPAEVPPTPTLRVTYTTDARRASGAPAYVATGCVVTEPGRRVECSASEGVGGPLRWTLEMGAVTGGGVRALALASSNATTGSTVTSNYQVPVLSRIVCGSAGSRLATQGGALCTLTGDQFGPAGTVVEVFLQPTTHLSISMGARNCRVSIAHTQLECQSPPGAGREIAWSVRIGGQTSVSFAGLAQDGASGFRPPLIHRLWVSRSAASTEPAPVDETDAFNGTDTVDTRGGEFLFLQGDQFGLSNWAVDAVVYGSEAVVGSLDNALDSGRDVNGDGVESTAETGTGPGALPPRWYLAASCVIVTPHSLVRCQTVQGLGEALRVRLRVGAQWDVEDPALPTPAAARNLLSFHRPTVVDVSGPATLGGSTRGGLEFLVEGDFLGPDASVLPVEFRPIEVTYGQDSGTEFAAAQCQRLVPHSRLRCISVPGVGKDLRVRVRVGGRSIAAAFPSTARYASPAVFRFRTWAEAQEGSAPIPPPSEDTPPPLTAAGSWGNVVASGTRGDARVLIEGSDFGESMDGIDRVVYRWEGTRARDEIAADFDGVVPPILDALTSGGGGGGGGGGGAPSSPGGSNLATSFDVQQEFVAEDCVMWEPHTAILCNTTEGAGRGLQWTVVVGRQPSVLPTTAYRAPTVVDVEGSGAERGWTAGGQWVVLRGMDFGPPAPAGSQVETTNLTVPFLQRVTYGPSGKEYEAKDCEVLDHETLRCRTVPSVGDNHRWVVRVQGQDSPLSTGTSSHAGPALGCASSLEGRTEGGDVVTFNGTDLGAGDDSAQVWLVWGDLDSSEEILFRSMVAPPTRVLADALEYVANVSDPTTPPSALGCPWDLDGPDAADPTALAPRPLEAVSFTVPEGEGTNIPVRVAVGRRGIAPDRSLEGFAVSEPRLFSYGRPVILELNTLEPSEGSGLDPIMAASMMEVVVYGINFGLHPRLFINNEEQTVLAYSHTMASCLTDKLVGEIRLAAGDQLSDARWFADLTPTIANLEGGDAGEDGTRRFRTEGGEAIRVVGKHFGSTVDSLNLLDILVGDRPCLRNGPLVVIELGFDDLQAIDCIVPPGEGASLPLRVIRGAQTSLASRVDYAPPVVTRVRPARLPTAGGDVWVQGDNFGIEHRAASLFSERSGLVELEVLFSNHTHMQVRVPPGAGAHYLLNLNIGGVVMEQQFFVDYETPVVESFTATGPTAGATITLQGRGFGSFTFLGDALARNVPAESANEFRPVLSLGGRPCVVADGAWTDASITCAGPQGEGRNLPLTVEVAGLLATFAATGTTTGRFHYDRPVVRRLSAVSGSTQGNISVVIEGSNFGLNPVVLFVSTGRVSTPDVLRLFDPAAVAAGDGFGGSNLPIDTLLRNTAAFLLSECRVGDVEGGFPSPLAVHGLAHLVAPWPALHPELHREDFHLVLRDGADPDPILAHNHTHIEVLVPAGHGSAKMPVVVAGCQASSRPEWTPPTTRRRAQDAADSADNAGAQPPVFVYDTARVTDVSPPRAPTDQCSVIALRGDSFGFNATVYLTSPLWTTAGAAAPIELPCLPLGSDNGPSSSSSPSSPSSGSGASLVRNHTLVYCVLPGGMGANVSVGVRAAGRDSLRELAAVNAPLHPAETFDFLPPTILSIDPRIPDARGQSLLLRGYSFGVFRGNGRPEADPLDPMASELAAGYWPASIRTLTTEQRMQLPRCVMASELFARTPVRVATGFGAFECANATLEDPTPLEPYPSVRCNLPGQPVGGTELSVSVALQVGTWPSSRFRVECRPGFYGQENETCLDCPQGGNCTGGLAEPFSEPGFWGVQVDTPDALCPPERNTRPTCPSFQPCEPPESCLANNTCATGYTGERCAVCTKGYYRLDGACIVCPDNALFLIIMYIVLAVGVCFGGYLLSRRSMNLAVLSIGVDYFQALSMFARTRIEWPPAVRTIFNIMSAFNLNLDLAAPECSFDFPYKTKFLGILALPLAASSIFLLLHLAKYIQKRFIFGQKKNANSHFPTLLSVFLIMLYYLYLYLTRTILSVFNCNPTTPPDGYTYLEVVFERCGVPGGTQLTLLPIAFIALVLYSFGFPGFVGFVLWKNRALVYKDQILRAMGTGDDRLSNPDGYQFRKAYHRLYFRFRPRYYYWILLLLARKALIAFTALMFRSNVNFQMAFLLLVFFAAFVLHTHALPFMSPSETHLVLKEHEVLAAKGGPNNMYASIQADLAANSLRQKKQVSSHKFADVVSGRFDRTVQRQQNAVGWALAMSKSLGLAAGVWLTNYNTIESIFLVCPVLLALAGIMFESGRFDNSLYVGQRDALAVACLVLLIISILYFLTVFFYDLSVQLKCGEAMARRSAAKKLKKGAAEGDADSTGKGGGGGGGSGGGGVDAGDMIVVGSVVSAGGDSDTTTNPLFLTGRGGGGGGSSSSSPEMDQLLSQFELTGELPPGVSLEVIQHLLRSQRGLITQLRDEVHALKRGSAPSDAAGAAASAAALSAFRSSSKKRFQQGQVRARGPEDEEGVVGVAGTGSAGLSLARLRGTTSRGGAAARGAAARDTTPRSPASAMDNPLLRSSSTADSTAASAAAGAAIDA